MKFYLIFLLTVVILIATWGCGTKANEEQPAPKQQSGLSAWELKHGIGPIKTQITLGPVNAALATKGKQIFETKCSACHKLDERYVGPPLGDVTQRRTPEFIMNQILNPQEMVQKHPEVKKLLAIYLTPMTFQNVTQEEARAILEFLRQSATHIGVQQSQ